MKAARPALELGGTFGVCLAALVVPFLFWPASLDALGMAAFAGYVVLAACLAADVAEGLAALCWPRAAIRLQPGAVERGRAAVVMTLCDDGRDEELAALRPLAEAGYPVYVLDDSRHPGPVPESLAGRVRWVRRASRRGAKAGNLNHWLEHDAAPYDFAILLDADSRMSAASCDALLRAATHAEQRDVAIVQAKISACVEGASLFARVMALGARPRTRVLERVHARLGLLLSHGHNQLIRLSALRRAGGFSERFSAEDTALSLALAADGWRSVLADAWSSEREPDTVAAYNRRTLRWAAQTLELFRADWRDAPLRLKALLCRHLAAYVAPVVGVLLLGVSLASARGSAGRAADFLLGALAFRPGYAYYGVCLWLVLATYLLHAGLRLGLAWREGVTPGQLALSMVLAPAVYATLLAPLALTLLATALGRPVRFVATGDRFAVTAERRWRPRLGRLLAAGALLGPLVAGALANPGALVTGFNGLWLAAMVASPLLLAAASRCASRRQRPPHSGAEPS